MPLMLGSKTYDPVDNFNTTPGLFDLHPAIGLYYATPFGHALVSAASPLPVTGAIGGVLDTDDNSIAPGQTTTLNIVENYFFDKLAAIWKRWEGGVDNSPTTSDQCGFVGGSVTDPLDAYADGDACCLHFDTSGRLLVTGTFTFPSTEDDDDAIAAGALARAEVLNIAYFSNLDNASIWERWTGRSDDDSLPFLDASPTVLGQTLISDGASWKRLMGAINNTVAPASPRGAFSVGVVRTSFDVFAAGDAAVDQYTVDGAKIGILRTQEPFEVLTSQAAIAGGGVLTSTAVQQNSLFAGSLGRHSLQGFVHYTGTASSLTIDVQISLDAAVTWVTTDSYTVLSGVASTIRDLCIAMGNRVRIRITNNDGVNGTGTTNIGFYLTHAH